MVWNYYGTSSFATLKWWEFNLSLGVGMHLFHTCIHSSVRASKNSWYHSWISMYSDQFKTTTNSLLFPFYSAWSSCKTKVCLMLNIDQSLMKLDKRVGKSKKTYNWMVNRESFLISLYHKTLPILKWMSDHSLKYQPILEEWNYIMSFWFVPTNGVRCSNEESEGEEEKEGQEEE